MSGYPVYCDEVLFDESPDVWKLAHQARRFMTAEQWKKYNEYLKGQQKLQEEIERKKQ
tara:strand:- start:17 stop:190 length:174 start_codon:yes stop_codon:yes gene_type:complete